MDKHQVQIVLTAEQKKKLKALAEKKRWSMNIWVIDQIEREYDREFPPAGNEPVVTSGIAVVKDKV